MSTLLLLSIVLLITLVMLLLVVNGHSLGRVVVGSVILFSLIFTTWYNLVYNPHFILWLCNFTAIMALILAFWFHQRLFDLFFYFAWTGDVLTLMIWDNPNCPSAQEHPMVWIAFWLKHTAPLILSLYFLKIEKRRLSNNAVFLAVYTMIGYTLLMFGYNLVFDQNILDLMEPTLDIERAFGPWPIYVLVNIGLAIIWYGAIHWVAGRLGLVSTHD